ncbi:MAG: hypothetical protein RMJ35_12850, partial [Phycisphaerales bacterium]|nr:hypothetical protein [Phycisphaerales bacterium]
MNRCDFFVSLGAATLYDVERAPLEPFKSPLRRWLALLMVLVGGELVLLFGGSALPLRRPVQAAVAVAVVAGVAAALWPLHLPRLQLTRLGRVAASVLCVLAATGYLYFTADRQGRSFLPRYTDEFSYLLQSKMLAAGRLWLPAHAHPEFFESFQIVVEPVYASIYFPGAALAYAVGVLIHAPQWLPPLVLSALCVELLRRIAGQWFGPAAGWLAALMLVGLSLFRLQSIMTMAQVPVLLAGLTMIWSWLRWRDSRGRGWFALLAVAAGWAAITRPVDALCFALPIFSAVAVELYRLGGTAAVRLGLLALACILPSLTIQLVFNRGITGAWFRTPFGFYAERFNPGTEYGFGRPAGLPQTQLPQKLAYYESFTRPFLQNHTPRAVWRAWKERRLRETLLNGLPHPVLLALLPVGMLSLGRSALAVAIAPLPLFALL